MNTNFKVLHCLYSLVLLQWENYCLSLCQELVSMGTVFMGIYPFSVREQRREWLVHEYHQCCCWPDPNLVQSFLDMVLILCIGQITMSSCWTHTYRHRHSNRQTCLSWPSMLVTKLYWNCSKAHTISSSNLKKKPTLWFYWMTHSKFWEDGHTIMTEWLNRLLYENKNKQAVESLFEQQDSKHIFDNTNYATNVYLQTYKYCTTTSPLMEMPIVGVKHSGKSRYHRTSHYYSVPQ